MVGIQTRAGEVCCFDESERRSDAVDGEGEERGGEGESCTRVRASVLGVRQ